MCSRHHFVLALVTLLLLGGSALAEEGNQAAPPAPPRSVQEQLQEQQQRITELERLLKQQATVLEQLQRQLATQVGNPEPALNSASATAPALEQSTTVQEVERLSGELDALAENSQQLTEKVDQLTEKTEKTEKNLLAKVKDLGNFSFSGDLRLRMEPFRGGTSADRNRARFRARLNVNSKFSDELRGGLRLATGDIDDPTSTNQTVTDFFKRKAFNIDRAFLIYTPNWFAPLAITGGKFGYTWKNTELTLDSEINPEGLSEVLSFGFEDRALSNITLVGYQLPFSESSSGPDSYMIGGALQTRWDLGPRLDFHGSASYSNWFRTDTIRAAQTDGSLKGSTNNNAASDTAFASRFGLLDLIAQFDVDTGSERWPLLLLFDYVTNTRACANVDIAGVACNPNDRQGYWAEVALGKTKKRHDINFGYTLIHIEREAVLGAFNFSDLRAPTNVVNHRLKFAYQAYKNLTLGYTLLIGRQPGTDEPWLKRSQIDAIYKF
jgi:hypothetical protein